MTKETKSFCLDPKDIQTIQAVADRHGLSASGALTWIIRDWLHGKESK